MTGPLVSVVMPAYNRERTIALAIDSVLGQSHRNLELIVVDDHSKDHTAMVARARAADPRVRVVGNPRKKGAQGARNTGILEARGEWIAFNDSDDEWLPHKLEKQLAQLQAHGFNPHVVVHGDAIAGDDARPLRVPWTAGTRRAYAALLLRPAPFLPALLASRAHLQAIGLLDEDVPSYQEWDTAIRLAHEGHFVHLRTALFRYHTGHAGTISGDTLRDVEGYRYVAHKHLDEIRCHHGDAALRHHCRFLVHRAARFGHGDAAQRLLREAQALVAWSAADLALLHAACRAGVWGRVALRLGKARDRGAMMAHRLRHPLPPV